MTVMTNRSPAGCEQKGMSFDEGQKSAIREAFGGTRFTTSVFLVFLVHSLRMGCWTKTTQRKTTTLTTTTTMGRWNDGRNKENAEKMNNE